MQQHRADTASIPVLRQYRSLGETNRTTLDMKVFLLPLFILLPFIAFCQSNSKIDSALGYKLEIPAWFQMKETGNTNSFGGTLPAISGIENVILITGFPKADFKSFEDFQTIYLTGNKFGQPTKYSAAHIWYGQKELVKIPNGVEQRVFILWKNLIYHDKYVLLETNKSFLWIQFVATPETYDINITKFEEFMSRLKIDTF